MHIEAQKARLAREAAFVLPCVSLAILRAGKVMNKRFKSDLATACGRVSSAARHRRQKFAILIDFDTPVMALVSGARAC